MIYSIIYYFDKNLIPIQKKMLNLTTMRISIKSNNSHVKLGNVEITNYQMKKCATQLIK